MKRRILFSLVVLVALIVALSMSGTPASAQGPTGDPPPADSSWPGVPTTGPLTPNQIKQLPAPPTDTSGPENQLQNKVRQIRADAAAQGFDLQTASTRSLDAALTLSKNLKDKQRKALADVFTRHEPALKALMAPVEAMLNAKGKPEALPSLKAVRELSNQLKKWQTGLDADVEKVLTKKQLTQYRASHPSVPELSLSNDKQAPAAATSSCGGNCYYAAVYGYYTYLYEYNAYVYAYYGYYYTSCGNNYPYYSVIYNYYAFIYASYAYTYEWNTYSSGGSTNAYNARYYANLAYSYANVGYYYAYYANYYCGGSNLYNAYYYSYYGQSYGYSAYYYADAAYKSFSSSVVVTVNEQGFDSCTLPNTSQMQTWRNSSPYRFYGLYIGGSSLSPCAGARTGALTSSWVSTVRSQGWHIAPIWVGPQASCSQISGVSHMSNDINTAYNQGRSEADSAASSAQSYGLTASSTGGTIIYYDMEAYDKWNTASCEAAVNSFISGWVSRMHDLSNKAGAYGSACAAHASDWASIANVPDDVWPAWYIYGAYNSGASTSSITCINNSYWANHQRILQYAGGHNETYGGVTLSLDSDVANAQMVANSSGQ